MMVFSAFRKILGIVGSVALAFGGVVFLARLLSDAGEVAFSLGSSQVALIAGVAVVFAVGLQIAVSLFRDLRNDSLKSTERLTYMAEAIGYASWEVDLVRDVIWWGVGSEKVFGRTTLESETGVEFWEKHVHPEDRDRVVASCDAALSSRETYWRDEYRIVREEGEVVLVLDQGRIIRDADGYPLRMIGGLLDITERSRSLEALKASESRYRDLAENLQDVFYNHDPIAGRMLYVNKNYERIWGRSVESLYENSLTFFESVVPEDRHLLQEAYARQLAGDSTVVEYRVNGPDGIRWIQDRAFPILDGTGAIRQIVGTARDITEALERNLALEASEKNLRVTTRELERKSSRLVAAQAVAKIGSWEVDLLSDEVTWSDETFRVFDAVGLAAAPSLNEVIAKIHPEDRDEVRNRFFASSRTPGIYSIEHRLIAADGVIKYIEERWEVVADAERRPVRVLGTCQDITERRQTENEKKRLLAAIEQLDDALLITDPDGTIVYANGAMEKMTRYPRHDIIGRNGIGLFLPDGPVWAGLKQGFPWRGIREQTTREGGKFSEECVISPVQNRAGSLVNLIAVKKDVSARLEMQARYREAERMTAVGQLAGGIAHDFNNMLTVVQVQAELAQCDPTLSAPLRAGLEMIGQAAARSADLTKELLAFARRQPSSPKSVNPGRYLQSMRPMLRSMIGEETDFVAVCAEGLWNVKLDVSQFDHVLANLCLNARDAVGGKGRIVVELANESLRGFDAASGAPPGDYVVLKVSDTGVGMTPEVLVHAFEPFFTTKEEGKGTGLGLAVVHGIVKQHNGYISLSSPPGQGVVARILFPRSHEAEEPRETPAQSDVVAAGKKILLVDDEPMLLKTIESMLQHLGYEVHATSDPREAVELGQEDAGFSLLLTDIVMPNMDGIELADNVHRDNPGLNCLFMSGYSDKKLSVHMREKWPNRILNKPFTVDELSRALNQAMRDNPAGFRQEAITPPT